LRRRIELSALPKAYTRVLERLAEDIHLGRVPEAEIVPAAAAMLAVELEIPVVEAEEIGRQLHGAMFETMRAYPDVEVLRRLPT